MTRGAGNAYRSARLVGLVVTLLLGGCSPPAEQAGSGGGIDLGQALGGDADPGYARADRPRRFEFPADHGPHPDFRNEWWYFTGHLSDPAGRDYGFQLTLFRIALVPPARRAQRASDWAADQLYMGHFAIGELDAPGPRRFHAHERFARGAAGLAGASPERVWLEDWSIEYRDPGRWRLHAAEDGLRLALDLQAREAVVLQGEDGLSRKSAEPGNASYYYSIPRLEAAGELDLGEGPRAVSGSAWLDREWSTSALGPDQVGWDWFSLQFDDGAELMYYQIRRDTGQADRHSAGVYLAPDGSHQRLDRDSLQLEVLEHWQSPRGGRYPARWRMTLPGLSRSLLIEPRLADQELDLSVRYWEGAVSVADAAGTSLGRGFVELTGYRAGSNSKPNAGVFSAPADTAQ